MSVEDELKTALIQVLVNNNYKVIPKPVENADGSHTISVTIKPGTVITPTTQATQSNDVSNVEKETKTMIGKYVIGNEKALIGGLSAGILSLLGQFGVNNQLTLKEAAYSLAAWVVTHVAVYLTTNTPTA